LRGSRTLVRHGAPAFKSFKSRPRSSPSDQLIGCGQTQFVNDQRKTTCIKGTREIICLLHVKRVSTRPLATSAPSVWCKLSLGPSDCKPRDESGATFSFGEESALEGRDVKQDVDAAMDLADPLPKCATRYAKLA
jgi:hypothetical protein